ncbi:hydrolase CocE/NonD family protein [Mycobacterium xenopi 3993]|nr:hydrolase CocE/NonD family protein [Mycobacterium xenopi 3993]
MAGLPPRRCGHPTPAEQGARLHHRPRLAEPARLASADHRTRAVSAARRRPGATPPPPTATPASFRYDPADPTPTVGGRLLSPDGGYRDDASLARRADVLSFTGDPLTEDLCVHGNPVIELAHSSDNPHVDVFVRISEVDARARSRNVSDGYRRLTGGAGAVHLEMDAIAHRFRAGSRIRVLVAGGCHPRFARNLGTGEPPVSGTELKPATHVVRFGASRLVLPLA